MYLKKELVEKSGMTYPGTYHRGRYKVVLEEENRIAISNGDDHYTEYKFDENGICEHKSFAMVGGKVYYLGDEIDNLIGIGEIVYATASDGLRFYSLVVVDCDKESLTTKNQYGVLYRVSKNHETLSIDTERVDGGTCHIKAVNVDYSLGGGR